MVQGLEKLLAMYYDTTAEQQQQQQWHQKFWNSGG